MKTVKPPFIAASLFKKLQRLVKEKRKQTIETHSRASTVLPIMIGHTIAVHNGREFLPVFVDEQMVGHKLGEFSLTKTFKSHIKSDKKAKRR